MTLSDVKSVRLGAKIVDYLVTFSTIPISNHLILAPRRTDFTSDHVILYPDTLTSYKNAVEQRELEVLLYCRDLV